MHSSCYFAEWCFLLVQAGKITFLTAINLQYRSKVYSSKESNSCILYYAVFNQSWKVFQLKIIFLQFIEKRYFEMTIYLLFVNFSFYQNM